MTIVVGTAGHIDHGKTALLRALTGIDADRLPEERRRGMTIDVGYAWMPLPDGEALDFVDVPGHDRLIGNMLVGAGEMDAALLVVAADDGPRPQTLEHLELLDALGIEHGVVAVTKRDLVTEARLAEVAADVGALLAGTTLAGSPIVAVSASDGSGLDELRAALADLRDRARSAGAAAAGPIRQSIDRVFPVRGRGTVVTGTLRGGPLAEGSTLRLLPADVPVRGREVQVHGVRVASAGPGGRVAVNLASSHRIDPVRGAILTSDPRVVTTSRLFVALRPARRLAAGTGAAGQAIVAGMAVRLHLGTAAVDGILRRSRRDVDDLPGGAASAILRLAEPVAAAPGDRFVLRRPSPATPLAGGRIIDPAPPTGAPWRRATREQVAALAAASSGPEWAAAVLVLRGAIARDDPAAADLPAGSAVPAGHVLLAVGLATAVVERAIAAATEVPAGLPGATLRTILGRVILRGASMSRDVAAEAAAALVEATIAAGRLARTGDFVHVPGRTVGPAPAVLAAMDRLERALDVPAPPSLALAARAADCPPDGVRALEAAGRILVVDADLAWARSAYRELARTAVHLAARQPVTPAALRDATGTSRKYVMALLEDLDRRAILRRTPDGHLPGPRARAAGLTGDADQAMGEPAPARGVAAQATGKAAPATGKAAPATGDLAPATGDAAHATGDPGRSLHP